MGLTEYFHCQVSYNLLWYCWMLNKLTLALRSAFPLSWAVDLHALDKTRVNGNNLISDVVNRWKLAASEIFHPVPAATSFNWFLWNSFDPSVAYEHTLESDTPLTLTASGAASPCDNFRGETAKILFSDVFVDQVWTEISNCTHLSTKFHRKSVFE